MSSCRNACRARYVYCCVGHHVTPSLALLSQLMGSQGMETVSEFCNNASRPKVSVEEWNEAMQPSNFEPTTVNMLFAKCLSKVRMGVSEGLCRMPPISMRCGVFYFYLLVVFGPSLTIVTPGGGPSDRFLCLPFAPASSQQTSSIVSKTNRFSFLPLAGRPATT